MIEIAGDFVYGFDNVLRWRGLEQNKEVMLPFPMKGWTRSKVAFIDTCCADKDKWLVISTDLRSKGEGEDHWPALDFSVKEWGTLAKAEWLTEDHPTCIFTDKQQRVKMMYTRFRKDKPKAASVLAVKRYAAAARVTATHLQFWIPVPPQCQMCRTLDNL